MRIALAVALACLGALLSPRPATAATLTWTGNGGSGDWNDAANWDGVSTPLSGDALIFAGVNQLALNDNLLFSPTVSLTFDNTAGAFTLGGGNYVATGITNSSANLQTVSTQTVIYSSQTWDAGSGGLAMGAILFSGSITLTLTLTGSGDTLVSGVISDSGLDIGETVSLAKTGSGVLTLSNANNSYNGGTAINGGTVRVGSNGNLGDAAGILSFDGGTLQTTASFTTTRATTLNAGGGVFNTDSATTLTHGGVISGSGGLTKSGAGTLTLSGANAYTGATAVDAGTLRAGAANVFGNGSALTVAAGAVLDLNGFSQTLGSLAGGGDVTLGAATLTAGGDNSSTAFSGAMSGSGALVKTGAGTLTLSGANT